MRFGPKLCEPIPLGRHKKSSYSTSWSDFTHAQDLFTERIKKLDLSVCWPDYKGGNDMKAALSYIKSQFIAVAVSN